MFNSCIILYGARFSYVLCKPCIFDVSIEDERVYGIYVLSYFLDKGDTEFY